MFPVALLIRAEGEIRPWGRYHHTYLDIDGYQCWTMGAPIANTIIINRSKLGESQGLPPKKPKHQSIAAPFALLA